MMLKTGMHPIVHHAGRVAYWHWPEACPERTRAPRDAAVGFRLLVA
jgi:hypothetical protein